MDDFGLKEELKRIREAADEMGSDAPEKPEDVDPDALEDSGAEAPEAAPGGRAGPPGETSDEDVEAVPELTPREEADDDPDVVDLEPARETDLAEPSAGPAGPEPEADETGGPAESRDDAGTEEAAVPTGDAAAGNGARQGGSALDRLSRAREGGADSRELGLEEELRLAVEVLEELLEMAPDRLDVLSRRVRYARRLGDPELRDEAEGDLVATLLDTGRETAARLAAEVFVHDRPEADGIAAVLDRLRRERTREALPRPEGGEGASSLRDAVVAEVVEAPDAESTVPLFLAFHAVASGTTDEAVARRHLAVYLREQGRLEEARETLEEALPGEESERAETLTELAVTELRLGEEGRARDRMERLAEIDAGVRELLEDLL